MFLNNIFMVIGFCLLCAVTAAQAQVARVLDSKGTALVERSGQLPRLLGAGERLDERDVINVARDSWAILEFNDQTRITLRPNTVFRLDSYKADAPESMLLGLVKGGFRMVTGLFGKRNPRGVSIQTATATIGIRGTEFDARLCEYDCAAETRATPMPVAGGLAVGRVLESFGDVAAIHSSGSGRRLAPGALIYEGEGVGTANDSYVVIVFRDQTRISLGQNGALSIHRFLFDENAPATGVAFLELLQGDAELETGWIAEINPGAFLFKTGLGYLRAKSLLRQGKFRDSRLRFADAGNLIRQGNSNSMFDVLAQSAIIQNPAVMSQQRSGDPIAVSVQQGAMELLGLGVVATGQAATGIPGQNIAIAGVQPQRTSEAVPLSMVKAEPSPFGRSGADIAPGLYVWVREGAVILDGAGGSVAVPAGNAAAATAAGVSLLDSVPGFMRFDTTPLPAGGQVSALEGLFVAADGSRFNECVLPVSGGMSRGTAGAIRDGANAIREGLANTGGSFSTGRINPITGMPGGTDIRSGREQAFDNAGKGALTGPEAQSFKGSNAGPISGGGLFRGDSFATGVANRGAQSGDVGLGQGRSNFSGGGRGLASSDGGTTFSNASNPDSDGFPSTTAPSSTVPSGGTLTGLQGQAGGLTSGDSAGVATGTAGGTVMGPDRHVSGAFTASVSGDAATRMTSVNISGSTNAPGARSTPSTVRVLILAPKPRDDDNVSGGGGGAPIYMRRGPQSEITQAGRAVGTRVGAGGANDGRTDQQQMTGSSVGMEMSREQQLGADKTPKPAGQINVDEILRIDRLVNPGAQ